LELYTLSLGLWGYELGLSSISELENIQKGIEKELKELGGDRLSKEQLWRRADEVWRADGPARRKE